MTDSPATRQSLLVRLKDPRDGQAWAEFVAIYAPLIDRLARARGLQAADAADLAQEVFRAVAGAIDRYDPDPARGSFRGWLFRIARNLMINLLAARRHPAVRPPAIRTSASCSNASRRPTAPRRPSSTLEYRRRLFLWAADAGSRRVPRVDLAGLLADRRRRARSRRCRGAGRAASRSGRCTSPGAGSWPGCRSMIEEVEGRIRFLAT